MLPRCKNERRTLLTKCEHAYECDHGVMLWRLENCFESEFESINEGMKLSILLLLRNPIVTDDEQVEVKMKMKVLQFDFFPRQFSSLFLNNSMIYQVQTQIQVPVYTTFLQRHRSNFLKVTVIEKR